MPATLDAVLTRTRDTDATIRKLVYTTLDPNNQQGGVLGITHPRALTVAQRELIVRRGLGDRELAVKTAAGDLVGVWSEVICDKAVTKNEKEPENLNTAVDDVVDFLKMFDLGEDTIAEDALLSVFTTQRDLFNRLKFEGLSHLMGFARLLNPFQKHSGHR
jgi:condensin complex subunit 3